MAKHRVEFMKFTDALLDLGRLDPEFFGQVVDLFAVVGQELMQRRVEQSDGARQAVEGLEDALKILALVRQQFLECLAAIAFVLGEDHLAHGVDAVPLEKHMLGAAQADTGGAERDGVFHLPRRVGVGANLHFGDLGTPVHDLREVPVSAAALGGGLVLEQALDDFRRGGLDFARENLAAGAVDGQEIAFLEVRFADLHGALCVVDLHTGSAANADFAHLPCNQCRVRADTAASSEDAVGGDHAA